MCRPILACVIVILAGVLSGCGDFQKAMETNRNPVTLPNMAPTELAGGPENVAPVGANAPAAGTQPAAATPAGTAGVPGSPDATGAAPGGAAPGAPPADKTGIIGKTTARIVDKPKAMAANAQLVELPNSLQGGDPVSLAANAYISLRGRASTLGFQNDIKLYHGENGRYPSYDELVAMMKTHNVAFAELPPFQVYGYDAATGRISILEDRDDKARRYKAAGIPVE